MTSPGHWYDLAHLPDAWRAVRVVVIWDFREMTVWRTREVKGRARWWRQDADGTRVSLPPKGRDQFWSDEPACWRPDGWDWPAGHAVPPPLPVHAVPRAVGTRSRFALVDEAEAAELAHEMERDRAMARDQADATARHGGSHTGLPRVGQRRQLWWLDASLIRRERKGSATRRDAEGRLMRALASDGFLMATAGAGLGLQESCALGRMLDEEQLRRLADIEVRTTPDFAPPFQPLPADQADFETATGWFNALGYAPAEAGSVRRAAGLLPGAAVYTDKQRLLALAARPDGMSFEEMGYVLRVSRQAAHASYGRAIDLVHRVANGFETRAAREIAASLAAVQAANRAARVERMGG